MYSIALVAITVAAAAKGDLQEGFLWVLQPGTYDEWKGDIPTAERTWSVSGKITVLVLFSSMGFFGSSCSAAITKNFGALTMSITSTARKATTLFLSFFMFGHVCTLEHISGIVLFISALTAKSLRRGRHSKQHKKFDDRPKADVDSVMDIEAALMPRRRPDAGDSLVAAPPNSRGVVRGSSMRNRPRSDEPASPARGVARSSSVRGRPSSTCVHVV